MKLLCGATGKICLSARRRGAKRELHVGSNGSNGSIRTCGSCRNLPCTCTEYSNDGG